MNKAETLEDLIREIRMLSIERSVKMSNIYIKMQDARIKLQEMNIKKSGKNKFSGFSYYELADFIPAINKIFGELKLFSLFYVNSDKEAILRIVNSEKPDEELTFTSPTASVDLKGCTEIQGIGAVHTYMKRYLYLNALEIVENDCLDMHAGIIKKNDKKDLIDNIKNIDDLNNVYYQLSKTKDTSWKVKLKAKADDLGAIFSKSSSRFEKELSEEAEVVKPVPVINKANHAAWPFDQSIVGLAAAGA
jgi:hypothetical protein